jgi:hypothetical protein
MREDAIFESIDSAHIRQVVVRYLQPENGALVVISPEPKTAL